MMSKIKEDRSRRSTPEGKVGEIDDPRRHASSAGNKGQRDPVEDNCDQAVDDAIAKDVEAESNAHDDAQQLPPCTEAGCVGTWI